MIRVKKIEKGNITSGSLQDLRSQKVVWVDIEKPSKNELQALAMQTKIPYEDLEDYISLRKRPMIFDVDEYSVIIFHAPLFEGSERNTTKSVVFIVSKSKNDLISLHVIPSRAVKRVREYPDIQLKRIMVHGATSILFTILDEIIASFFHSLDEIDERVKSVENKVMTLTTQKSLMKRIHDIKRTLLYFHRALVANRDVISAIEKDYLQNIDRRIIRKFAFLYSDLIQLIELEATYRDILTSSLEVHLSAVSNYLNVVIKRITSWGALILVPSFIASVFGMNFKYIPESNEPYGFFGAIVIMVISVASLYYYFRKKDWI